MCVCMKENGLENYGKQNIREYLFFQLCFCLRDFFFQLCYWCEVLSLTSVNDKYLLKKFSRSPF